MKYVLKKDMEDLKPLGAITIEVVSAVNEGIPSVGTRVRHNIKLNDEERFKLLTMLPTVLEPLIEELSKGLPPEALREARRLAGTPAGTA